MNCFQVQAFSSSNLEKGKGTFGSIAMIAKHQGWRQLFSGLSINYLKVRIAFPVSLIVYLLAFCLENIFSLPTNMKTYDHELGY